MNINLKKIVSTFLVTILVLFNVFLASPQKAQAQVGTFIMGTVETAWNTVQDFLWDAFVVSGSRALMNATQLVTQRLAYESAVWLSSAAVGQAPLVNDKGAKERFEQIFSDAAGEALGTLSQDWGSTFDVCNPSIPQVKVGIGLGAFRGTQPQAPKCDLKQITDNWQNFIEEVNQTTFLGYIQNSFDITQNDFGAMISINDQLLAQRNLKQELELLEKGRPGEYTNKTTAVSKRVTTNKDLVKAQTEQRLVKDPAQQRNTEWLATYISGSIRPQSFGMQLVATMSSTFINTFGSQLTKKIFEGLLQPVPQAQFAQGGAQGTSVGGREAAQAQFASFIRPPVVVDSDYDYLSVYSTCPDQGRTPYNCTMDESFYLALNTYKVTGQGMTIQEAIDQKLLDPNKTLLSPTSDKNKDPKCYQEAYCYDNLVKLRRARIISVGWELAAEACSQEVKDTNGATICGPGNPPSLEDVIANYDNCSGDIKSNPYSTFCHLIDPNWVLKAPAAQCDAKVPGSQLAITQSPQRADVCVDDKTCIVEREDGQCEAYGYCTREKNVWKFGGQECSEQFDSCRTYQRQSGGSLSVLDKTIDSGICDESNAGCLWYSTNKTVVNNVLAWSDSQEDRLFLNSKIQTCNQDEAGCTEFIRTAPGIGTNVLKNGSFEDNAFDSARPDHWSGSFDQYSSADGFSELQVNATGVTQYVAVQPNRVYRFSASLKNTIPVSTGAARVEISLDEKTGTTIRPIRQIKRSIPVSSQDYSQESFVFTVDIPTANVAKITLAQDSGAIWYDQVMLEEILPGNLNQEIQYADYGTKNQVNLKKAPDYLGCYKEWNTYTSEASCINAGGDWDGDKCNAPSSCDNYAAWCSPSEVGCQLYSPTNNVGAPVAGTPTANDYCPFQCEGYSTFKQMGNIFEEDVFPLYIIPSSAQQCSAEEAGCDEFTNLDTLESGQGEAREYYTELRLCQKPDSKCKLFYTWEGQDTAGYQLKTFNLTADLNPADGIIKPADFGTGTDTCNEQVFRSQSNPDCREFYYVDDSGKTHISYRSYSRTKTCSNQCHPYKRTRTVVASQSECTAVKGEWVNNQCIYYGLPSESKGCSAQSDGCREYKGNTGNNVLVSFNDSFENGANEDWNGGVISNVASNPYGRSIQNQGGATLRKTLFDTNTNYVEKGKSYTLKFWARSLQATGGQLQIRQNLDSSITYSGANFGQAQIVGQDWKQYTIGPITFIPEEATNIKSASVELAGLAQGQLFIDNAELLEISDTAYLIKDTWNTPAICDNNNATPFGRGTDVNPTRENPQAQLNCQAYTDTQSRVHYLKSFTNLCRESAVGCEALIDTKNSQTPGLSLYNIKCEIPTTGTVDPNNKNICIHKNTALNNAQCNIIPGKNYCYINKEVEAGIQSNQDPLIAQLESESDSFTSVKADEMMYLVNDPEKRCDSSAKGCEEIALPTLNADQQVDKKLPEDTQWSVKYIINNPDLYSRILCNNESLFCEEFVASDDSRRYFKDPKKRVCEYREGVLYQGRVIKGWFRQKVEGEPEEPCYPNNGLFLNVEEEIVGGADVVNKQSFYLAKAGTAPYQNPFGGWVGLCPQEQNMCTLFIDPLGTSQTNQRNYYFIKDENLDTKSCNGLVNLEEGCVLFNDTSNGKLTFHSEYSYKLAREAKKAVSPKACPEFTFGQEDKCKDFDIAYNEQRAQNQLGGNAVINQPVGQSNSGSSSQTTQQAGQTQATLPGANTPAFGGSGNGLGLIAEHPNNTNVVIKVNQDRVCGEWISCQSKSYQKDENGKTVEICDALVSCSQYDASNLPSQCAQGTDLKQVPRRVLDLDSYQKRGSDDYESKESVISWADRDYSGYSLPNKYPLQYFESLVFQAVIEEDNNKKAQELRRLFYDSTGTIYRDQQGKITGVQQYCTEDKECKALQCDKYGLSEQRCITQCSDPATYDDCRVNFPEATITKCISNRCVANIDGTEVASKGFYPAVAPKGQEDVPRPILISEDTIEIDAPMPMCRAYPDKDAPFNDNLKTTAEFANANFCEGSNCGAEVCEYQKVTYGNKTITKYFPPKELNSNPVWDGVCQGGVKDGKQCSTNNDCVDPNAQNTQGQNQLAANSGTCRLKDTQGYQMLGWQGYCIERFYEKNAGINGKEPNQPAQDYEYPCLTWLPVQHMAGLKNLYNKDVDAGLNVASNLHYCAETTLVKDILPTQTMCADLLPGEGVLYGNNWTNETPHFNRCKANIECPDGYFVALGNPMSWGTYPYKKDPPPGNGGNGGNIGWCNQRDKFESSRCPYQCIPLGAKHASTVKDKIVEIEIPKPKYDNDGKFLMYDHINKDWLDQAQVNQRWQTRKISWKEGESCWDTLFNPLDGQDETLGLLWGVDRFGRSQKEMYYVQVSNPAIINPETHPQYPLLVNADGLGAAALIDNPQVIGDGTILNPTYYNYHGTRGPTIFDDCVVANVPVDPNDSIGKNYAELYQDAPGEYRLACKEVIQVTKGEENRDKVFSNKAYTDRVALLQNNKLPNYQPDYKISVPEGRPNESTFNYSYLPFRVDDNIGEYHNVAWGLLDFDKNKKVDAGASLFALRDKKSDIFDGIQPTIVTNGIRTSAGKNISLIKGTDVSDTISGLGSSRSLSFHAVEYSLEKEDNIYDPKVDKVCDTGKAGDCNEQCKPITLSYKLLECTTNNDCNVNGTSYGECANIGNGTNYCEYPLNDAFRITGSQLYTAKYCTSDYDCSDNGKTKTIQCDTAKNYCKGTEFNYDKNLSAKLRQNFSQCEKSGKFCSTSNDCRVGTCDLVTIDKYGKDVYDQISTQGNGICKYTDSSKRATFTISQRGVNEESSKAVERLQRLFAQVYGTYRLKETVGDKSIIFNHTGILDKEVPKLKDIKGGAKNISSLNAFSYSLTRKIRGVDSIYKSKVPSEAISFEYKSTGNEQEDFTWKDLDIAKAGKGTDHTPGPPILAAPSSDAASGYKIDNSISVNGQVVEVGSDFQPIIEMKEGEAVRLLFYAWADKNQMPIRKMTVSWSDETNKTVIKSGDELNNEDLGWYKNRKPECDTDLDGFGGSKQACEEDVFRFEHHYILREAEGKFDCSKYSGGAVQRKVPESDALKLNGENQEREYCDIQMRIHVLDNWGWCTGTCDNGVGNGCYATDYLKSNSDNWCSLNPTINKDKNGGIRDPWLKGPILRIYAMQ